MKSDCELVRKGEVKRRGNTADRAISSWEKNDSLYKASIEDGE